MLRRMAGHEVEMTCRPRLCVRIAWFVLGAAGAACEELMGALNNPVYDEEGDPICKPVGAPLDHWLPRRFELGL